MLTMLQQYLLRRLHRWFHGNPLVTQPRAYFTKVKQAYHVWLIALLGLVGLAGLGSVVFVIGALHGWF